MKDELCRAFCDDLRVNEVPVGLAVSTSFRREDGDAIGFYVVYVGEDKARARLEDDGDTIPYIEACGVDLGTQTRSRALAELLSEYSAEYDADEGILRTLPMGVEDLPKAAIKFVALLLRVRDLLLLTTERVASTFRDDAIAAIKERFAGHASVEVNVPISPHLESFPVDVVIRKDAHQPLAVYIGTAENRLLEAMILRMETAQYTRIPCKVAVLLEELHGHGIKESTIGRAMNRLDYVGPFKGNEQDVMDRLERELAEATPSVH